MQYMKVSRKYSCCKIVFSSSELSQIWGWCSLFGLNPPVVLLKQSDLGVGAVITVVPATWDLESPYESSCLYMQHDFLKKQYIGRCMCLSE